MRAFCVCVYRSSAIATTVTTVRFSLESHLRNVRAGGIMTQATPRPEAQHGEQARRRAGTCIHTTRCRCTWHV